MCEGGRVTQAFAGTNERVIVPWLMAELVIDPHPARTERVIGVRGCGSEGITVI